MKKLLTLSVICMLALGAPAMTVSASSLDEIVGQTQQPAPSNPDTTAPVETPVQPGEPSVPDTEAGKVVDDNAGYIEEIKQATDLSEISPGATKLNEGTKKVASFIVQVLSYFITAFLVVRIIIDVCYITIPFTRSFLANGYQGNVQAGVGMADGGMGGMGGMGSPMGGMSGMGMGGMGMGGMSGMGMGGGMYGRGRMGMGMGGMRGGMMGQQQNMQGANPIMGRVQWVSTAALNAVAAESSGGLDGQPDNALKVYMKDMTVVLILTPILLVLAITGALTDLGFLLGELLVNALQGVGNMV